MEGAQSSEHVDKGEMDNRQASQQDGSRAGMQQGWAVAGQGHHRAGPQQQQQQEERKLKVHSHQGMKA